MVIAWNTKWIAQISLENNNEMANSHIEFHYLTCLGISNVNVYLLKLSTMVQLDIIFFSFCFECSSFQWQWDQSKHIRIWNDFQKKAHSLTEFKLFFPPSICLGLLKKISVQLQPDAASTCLKRQPIFQQDKNPFKIQWMESFCPRHCAHGINENDWRKY